MNNISIHQYEEVSSTMDIARMYYEEHSACNGCEHLFIAQTQTQGRGRLGSTWHSTEGSFLGTFLSVLPLSLNELSPFSLLVGVLVARVLDPENTLLGLKWPNDILTKKSGLKIGGILIEIFSDPQTLHSVVLTGIGLNLSEKPQEIESSAAYTDTKNVMSLDLFTNRISEEYTSAVQSLTREKLHQHTAAWKDRAMYIGKKIQFRFGETVKEGTFCGVNESGHLLLQDEQNYIKAYASGEVKEIV
jgi:BirA family transcriptional regulator, biotin operon repressor / biotin---[acetyl-CoA-carboxylase] ligase